MHPPRTALRVLTALTVTGVAALCVWSAAAPPATWTVAPPAVHR